MACYFSLIWLEGGASRLAEWVSRLERQQGVVGRATSLAE